MVNIFSNRIGTYYKLNKKYNLMKYWYFKSVNKGNINGYK